MASNPEPHDALWRGSKWQTTRKEYRCCCGSDDGHCSKIIRPGDRYCRETFIDLDAMGPRAKMGKYDTVILCAKCAGSQGEA